MSGDAWITLGLLVTMLAVLIYDRLPPAAVILGTTSTLLLTDVITTDEAFAGFSNTAPITVALLYILARAAQKTGLLTPLTSRLLGDRPGRAALARLLVPTAGASSLFNNTPLVAMLIPDLVTWSRNRGISASRFLLPLSYAAILGGVTTLLGTSTNLIVSGLLEDATGEPFGVFEITKVGLPVAVVALVVLIGFAANLVPERLSAPEQAEAEAREFVVHMEVEEGGPLEGKTIAEAGLRDLAGVFLVEIEREGMTVSPVAPDRRINGGDVLRFVGRARDIVDLQLIRGLRSAEEKHLLAIDSQYHTYFEAVIGRTSPLLGRTVRDSGFRGTYGAAVVAIHRDGQRLDAKLGDVEFRQGDTLLLLAAASFLERFRDSRDFLLIARLGGPAPSASKRAPIVGAVTTAMVLLAAIDVVPILEGALIGIAVLLGTRCITFNDARSAVDLDVVVLIGSAFGLGAAMQKTGLALEIADGLTAVFDPFGTAGIVFGIVLATAVLTELVTNNAAAVVMFPIAFAAAQAEGLDPRLVAVAVAVSASASFLTPIGYQTNTMVFGPGGYRFTDYLRVGIPMTLTVLVVTTAMVTALA